MLLSTGLGVRLLVPKMLRTGICADSAITLVGGQPTAGGASAGVVGFSFGVFQFFSSSDRFSIR